MADSMSEGTLSMLRKQVGENIDADEELASIKADKIDVSVNAPETGVVIELLAALGDIVTAGQDIARIDTEAKEGLEAEKSLVTSAKRVLDTMQPKPQSIEELGKKGSEQPISGHAQKTAKEDTGERKKSSVLAQASASVPGTNSHTAEYRSPLAPTTSAAQSSGVTSRVERVVRTINLDLASTCSENRCRIYANTPP